MRSIAMIFTVSWASFRDFKYFGRYFSLSGNYRVVISFIRRVTYSFGATIGLANKVLVLESTKNSV